MLWTGPDTAAAFEGLLASVGQQDLPRTPVDGLGEGAFAIFYDGGEHDLGHQSASALVIFGAGPPTVAVTVNADDGQPAEAALPATMAVAKAVAAKLK